MDSFGKIMRFWRAGERKAQSATRTVISASGVHHCGLKIVMPDDYVWLVTAEALTEVELSSIMADYMK